MKAEQTFCWRNKKSGDLYRVLTVANKHAVDDGKTKRIKDLENALRSAYKIR